MAAATTFGIEKRPHRAREQAHWPAYAPRRLSVQAARRDPLLQAASGPRASSSPVSFVILSVSVTGSIANAAMRETVKSLCAAAIDAASWTRTTQRASQAPQGGGWCNVGGLRTVNQGREGGDVSERHPPSALARSDWVPRQNGRLTETSR